MISRSIAGDLAALTPEAAGNARACRDFPPLLDALSGSTGRPYLRWCAHAHALPGIRRE